MPLSSASMAAANPEDSPPAIEFCVHGGRSRGFPPCPLQLSSGAGSSRVHTLPYRELLGPAAIDEQL